MHLFLWIFFHVHWSIASEKYSVFTQNTINLPIYGFRVCIYLAGVWRIGAYLFYLVPSHIHYELEPAYEEYAYFYIARTIPNIWHEWQDICELFMFECIALRIPFFFSYIFLFFFSYTLVICVTLKSVYHCWYPQEKSKYKKKKKRKKELKRKCNSNRSITRMAFVFQWILMQQLIFIVLSIAR